MFSVHKYLSIYLFNGARVLQFWIHFRIKFHFTRISCIFTSGVKPPPPFFPLITRVMEEPYESETFITSQSNTFVSRIWRYTVYKDAQLYSVVDLLQ